MSPFSREPRVVEVEPADHRADVERGCDGLELVASSRHARALLQLRARHDGAEQLRARREAERENAAAERVHEAVARDLARLGALRGVAQHVIGDFGEQLVRSGALRAADVVGAHGSMVVVVSSRQYSTPC